MEGVRIWSASLERPADEVAHLFDLLSPTERARATRFHGERDRRRFVVARGTLRTLLGNRVGLAPERITITIERGGKPVLPAGAYPSRVHFNVSHSDELALFAIADREIGIDVERLKETRDIERVAAHFFAPDESAVLERLDEAERARYFFRTWVRKEAYLKATGKGLAISPARVKVPPSADGCILLEDENGMKSVDNRYAVHDITGIEGYAAAVAIGGWQVA